MLGSGNDIYKDMLWLTVGTALDTSWEGRRSAGLNLEKFRKMAGGRRVHPGE